MYTNWRHDELMSCKGCTNILERTFWKELFWTEKLNIFQLDRLDRRQNFELFLNTSEYYYVNTSFFSRRVNGFQVKSSRFKSNRLRSELLGKTYRQSLHTNLLPFSRFVHLETFWPELKEEFKLFITQIDLFILTHQRLFVTWKQGKKQLNRSIHGGTLVHLIQHSHAKLFIAVLLIAIKLDNSTRNRDRNREKNTNVPKWGETFPITRRITGIPLTIIFVLHYSPLALQIGQFTTS